MNEERMYRQLASIERARAIERQVIEFGVGVIFAVVLLVAMVAPWS